jgi:hypothetical protein
MKRSRFMKPTRRIAGLVTGLLFASLALLLNAQPAGQSHAQHPLIFGYDKAHEITLNGTIQKVISAGIPGSPVGVHLLVAGSQGTVDAHLGPYLTKETQEAMRAGVPVQIIGAMERLHGKNYLLARQLIFSGRTVTVRSENGLLVRAHAPRAARPIADNPSQVETNGGAR